MVKAPDVEVEPDSILHCLRPHFAKWQLPDEIVFADDLPYTATGKISKRRLRERYRGHVWTTGKNTS